MSANQIGDNKVVQFHYTLSKTDGEVVETTRDGEPLAYLHGHDNMLPAIEKALLGKTVGDKIEMTLPPEETYGERQEGAEQRVPLKHLQGLPKGQKWKPGMVAIVETDQGRRQVSVIKPGLKMVLIDLNHPLAGMTLSYDIEIIDLRDASDEEIAHCNAPGAAGPHH